MEKLKRASRFGMMLMLVFALTFAACACSQDTQMVDSRGKVTVKSVSVPTEEPTPEPTLTSKPVDPLDPLIQEALDAAQANAAPSAQQSPLPSGSPVVSPSSTSASPEQTQAPVAESESASSATTVPSQSVTGNLGSGLGAPNIAVMPTRELPTGQDPKPTQESVDTSGGFFGVFEVQDLDGNSYTNDLFAQNDLTVVNMMATWCGPCINEMPALQALSDSLQDSSIAFYGIAADTSQRGTVDQDAVATAKQIKDRTGVTYPLLIPDAGGFNGALGDVAGYPTTFFIGKDGQQVATPVVGALDLENWQRTISEILSQLDN